MTPGAAGAAGEGAARGTGVGASRPVSGAPRASGGRCPGPRRRAAAARPLPGASGRAGRSPGRSVCRAVVPRGPVATAGRRGPRGCPCRRRGAERTLCGRRRGDRERRAPPADHRCAPHAPRAPPPHHRRPTPALPARPPHHRRPPRGHPTAPPYLRCPPPARPPCPRPVALRFPPPSASTRVAGRQVGVRPGARPPHPPGLPPPPLPRRTGRQGNPARSWGPCRRWNRRTAAPTSRPHDRWAFPPAGSCP